MSLSEYPIPYGNDGWFIVYPGTIEKELGVKEAFHRYSPEGLVHIYQRLEVTETAYSVITHEGFRDGVDQFPELIETLIYRPLMKYWGRGLSLGSR